MNRILTMLCTIIAILTLSCENKEDKISKILNENYHKSRTKLIEKYKPLNLDNEFSNYDLVLSAEIERKLSSNKNRLIYSAVRLNDLIINDSSYVVEFCSDIFANMNINMNYYLTLDCSLELGNMLLELKLDDLYGLTIIADITSFHKIRFEMLSVGKKYYTTIEVYPSHSFEFKGELIDFVFIEYNSNL